MTRGEEKVVSEVGGTSMLPGNEHRPGAQTKGGRADPPLAHTQKSRCCGPGRRPPDAAQSWAGSLYKGETAILSLIPRRPSLCWERIKEEL